MILLNGAQIISSGCDDTIKIWNYNTSTVIRTLRNHTDCVRDILLLNNQTLLSGSDDFSINIWNITNGVVIQRIRTNSTIICLEMLRNGHLASGSGNGTLDIWNLEQRSLVFSFIPNAIQDEIRALKLLPDGSLAVCGKGSFNIRIWNTTSWTFIRFLVGHTSVLRYSLIPYNGKLISVSTDTTIRVWDPSTGVSIATLTGHTDLINKAELFNNKYLASVSADKTVIVWDLETFKSVVTIDGFTTGTSSSLYLGDGLLLIGSSNSLEIWKIYNLD